MDVTRTAQAERGGGGGLLGVALAIGGGLLYRVAGGPHLPGAVPGVRTIQATLTGSVIPYAALGAFCTTLAWALWLWLAATLVLQLLLALAAQATNRARWVRSLRLVVDPLTLPAVRRLVHGTAVAVTVAQLALRSVPSVAAAPVGAAPAALVLTNQGPATGLVRTAPQAQGETTHVVRPGDTLWTLAERYYGNGDAWPRIISANVGRRMPDGAVFPRNPVLQPGWVLVIPDARPVAPGDAAVTPPVVYTVREGDNLRAIAQRFYGDELAWPRIFDANRGAHLADGRTLTNPDKIWAGMRLTIPGVPPAQPPARLPAASPVPPAAPAAQQTSAPAPRAHPVPPASRRPVRPGTPQDPLPARSTAPVTAPAQQQIPLPPPLPVPSVSPTVAPVAVTATAHAAPDALPSVSALGLAGLAALGAGATVLLARRRRRTPGMPADCDAGIPVHDGYADPAHAPTFGQRLFGGGEPALLVAEQVQYCLDDAGLDDARLIAVREGRHTMTLTVEGRLATQQRLLDLGPVLAERLWAQARIRPTVDHDIAIQLSRLGQLRLVAPPSVDAAPPLPLVALGVLPTREALHVNWQRCGNVLISGTNAHAVGAVLTSVLTALTARCHPDALRVWVAAARDTLMPALGNLPHLAQERMEVADSGAVQRLIQQLVDEGERRATAGAAALPAPELLLVLGELGAVPECALLPLLERGPALGIRVLAATARPDAVSAAVLSAVPTQLVLPLPDEEASIRSLGSPDAAHLDDGELLVRLDDRAPLRVRAFRVEERHLERLIEQMHAAYGAGARGHVDPEEGPVAAEVVEEAEYAVDDDGAVANGADQPSPPPANPTTATEPSPAPAPAASVAVMTETNGSAPVQPSANDTAVTAWVAPAVPVSSTAAPEPTAPSAPLLYVRCFGSLQVFAGEREISCLNQHQAWELLAYLATHGGSVSRQEIFDVFWPEVEGAVVGNRLDAVVHRLKKALAAQVGDAARDLLSRERGKVELDRSIATSDVQQFDMRYQRLPRVPAEQVVSELEAALALAGDELLEGADYAWLEQPGEDGLTLRERYEERVAKLTHELACRYRDTGQVAQAIALFRRLLADQPTLQPAARGLYRCFALVKDKDALAQAHARLGEALRRERQAVGADLADSYMLSSKTLAAYQQAKEEIQGEMAARHVDVA